MKSNYQIVVLETLEDPQLKLKVLNSFINKERVDPLLSPTLRILFFKISYTAFLKKTLTGKSTNRMLKQYLKNFSFFSLKEFYNNPTKNIALLDSGYRYTLFFNTISEMLFTL